MSKIVCSNCGADVFGNEAKCPFCGYINISGAEEKFMRDIQKTESDMSEIPELQQKEYKKHMSKNTKIVLITIGIVVMLLGILFGLIAFFEKILYSYDEVDVKAQMLWQRENYPILDEMYNKGDYDGIIEFYYDLYIYNDENDTQYSIYEWDHYHFIDAYRRYTDVESYISDLDRGIELSDYAAESLVYYCMWFHYREYDTDNEFMRLTDEEVEILDGYRKITDEYLFGRLGFTEEEAEDLYIKAVEKDGFGSMDMQTCWKYGRKIKNRFK